MPKLFKKFTGAYPIGLAKVNFAAKILRKQRAPSSTEQFKKLSKIKEEYQTETVRQINRWVDKETKQLNDESQRSSRHATKRHLDK